MSGKNENFSSSSSDGGASSNTGTPFSSLKATSSCHPNNSNDMNRRAALVFGASGEQGQHVICGLLDAGYNPVYGVTTALEHVDTSFLPQKALQDGSLLLLEVDLNNVHSIQHALQSTQASAIFLVTTTDLPPEESAAASLKESEEREYDAIASFFDTIVSTHKHDGLSRHVIFSTFDDVETLNTQHPLLLSIKPLDDGSIVPHYSGKGRAGQYALQLFEKEPRLCITLLTLPFLHSNFLASAIPLPDEGKTQWTISACFDDSPIDMFSASDLAYIVPAVLDNPLLYDGYNLRLSAERITMDEVASIFADLFGKDVIYNPLTVEEMTNALSIPGAQAFAQMCQFLSNPLSKHDVDVTETVMFPRKPQLFKDWLLTHSDHAAFERVGLALDGVDITSVTVFGAAGKQGMSVVKGLLADTRKRYTIRATTRHVTSDKANAVRELDPERVTIVYADYDDVESCRKAVDGVHGAFLVTDFYSNGGDGDGGDAEREEQHARNVIDACESSHSVRHLVFSTLESVEDMNRELKLGLDDVEDGKGKKSTLPQFDAKARAAAYARTKKLSVTYVLMPVYSEKFLELMAPEIRIDEETGETTHVMLVPGNKRGGDTDIVDDGDEAPLMCCMSVEELGPAVANIFDSYQVYAGHEIGLVTDFVTMSEAAEMIEDVFFSEGGKKEEGEEGDEDDQRTKAKTKVRMEREHVDTDTWVEKRSTVAKDLGQMFRYYSKTDAVKKRRSIAQTLQLVPDARPLRKWLEENRDNVEFRQMLGLR